MCSASAVRISPWIERWCCLAMCRKASSISTDIRMENDFVWASSCMFIHLLYTQTRRMSRGYPHVPSPKTRNGASIPMRYQGRGFTRRCDKLCNLLNHRMLLFRRKPVPILLMHSHCCRATDFLLIAQPGYWLTFLTALTCDPWRTFTSERCQAIGRKSDI